MSDTKTWEDASKENFGLLMKGLTASNMYKPEDFCPPYDKIFEYIVEKGTWTKEDLYAYWSNTSPLDMAMQAASNINGQSKTVNFPSILRRKKGEWAFSRYLVQVGKQGEQGNLPPLDKVMSMARSYINNDGIGLRDAREVDWENVKGLQKCGWDALDKTIGGIAESGPVVVVATTKTGKSFWTAKLIKEFLEFYPNKTAGIFALELTDARYLQRAFGMYPSLLKAKDEGRVFITHQTRSIEGIMSDVAIRGCDIVVIDGIDGLVKGEFGAGTFARAWHGIIELGVVQNVPVITTTQPNRAGKKKADSGEFLGRYDIEWSGGAENGAEQLIALQHVPFERNHHDKRFPVFDDTYYMISWLQRERWPMGGPGAIILRPDEAEYDKNGNRVMWGGKPYGPTDPKTGKMLPKIWTEGSYVDDVKRGAVSSMLKDKE